jgi:hypothetical protein
MVAPSGEKALEQTLLEVEQTIIELLIKERDLINSIIGE